MSVFAVEFGKLLQVVWVSLAAGVGVTFLYSLVIFNSARASEARRAGRGGPATLHVVLALLAFAIFAAGVGLGVSTMLAKD